MTSVPSLVRVLITFRTAIVSRSRKSAGPLSCPGHWRSSWQIRSRWDLSSEYSGRDGGTCPAAKAAGAHRSPWHAGGHSRLAGGARRGRCCLNAEGSARAHILVGPSWRPRGLGSSGQLGVLELV